MIVLILSIVPNPLLNALLRHWNSYKSIKEKHEIMGKSYEMSPCHLFLSFFSFLKIRTNSKNSKRYTHRDKCSLKDKSSVHIYIYMQIIKLQINTVYLAVIPENSFTQNPL